MEPHPISILLLTERPQQNSALLTLLTTERSAADAPLGDDLLSIEECSLDQWVDLPRALADRPCDLVILDFFGPADLALVRQVHQHLPALPLIVIGLAAANEVGVEAIQAGAQEYLDRTQLEPKLLMQVLRQAFARGQVQKQAARLVSEGRFGHVLEMSPGLILIHDGEKIVYVNSALTSALGLSVREQILGHSPFELVHPDERREAMRQSEGVLQTGQPSALHELRWVRPDGTLIEVEAVHIPVELGQRPGVVIILRNITRRKQAEAAARQAHVALAETLDHMSDVVFAIDHTWRFTYFNQRATEFLGRPPETMIGQELWQAFPMLIGTPYEVYYREALEQREVRQFEARAAISQRWYAVSVYPSSEGLTIFGRDISERKAAEAILRQSHDELERRVEERTQALVAANQQLQQEIAERKRGEAKLRDRERQLQEAQNLAHLGSWDWDILTNVLTWSPELYRIYGLPPDQLMPNYERFLAHIHPADREWVQQLIEQATQNYHPFVFEHRIVRPNGEVRVLEARGAVVQDETGRPVKMLGTGQDITVRKALEAELTEMRRRLDESREAERLYLAQELHDLPLQELYSMQIALTGLAVADEAAATQVQFVRESLDRTMQMLRGLVNELRPPLLEIFGLTSAIRDYVESYQQQHTHLSIHLQLALEEIPLSQSVGLALFRICQQALHNVVKHAKASEAWVRLYLEADEVALEIQDNGCGFVVPQRWVDLTRRDHFGLAVSAERAEHVGGHFRVQSTPEAGTIVRVRAPLGESSRQRVAENPTLTLPSLGREL